MSAATTEEALSAMSLRWVISRWLGPIALVFLFSIALQEAASGSQVDRVQIEGNQAFSDRQIKKLMKTKGSRWYRKRPLIRRYVEMDLANIEAFYHKHGFLEAGVTSQEIPSADADRLTVRILIQEGQRTFIQGLRFQGHHRLGDAHLGRGLLTRVGQPLDLSLVRADMKIIADRYGDVGYPYAVVSADVARDSILAQITFQISEGQPVHIGRVIHRGLREVRASVVRRELTLHPGDQYSRAQMLDSRQRIYSTGLFSFVDVHLEVGADDSLRPDLAVVVQEKPMRWVGIRTDVGQDEQYDLTSDLTAEWGHKNLFASGRKLSLAAIATFRVFTEWENLKNRLELTYTEPWFLGRRMPAWMKLYYEPGLRSKGRSYRVQRFGTEYNMSRELGQFSRAWLAVRYERVDIFGIDPEVAEILRLSSGQRIRRYLSASWERDTRDEIFQPSRGSLTQLISSFAGGPLGGDDHYIKAEASWNRYQRLFPSTIMASRIKMGWAKAHRAGLEVPPDVRFYAGGANTIRGFQERSLGSLDPLGNPLGGNGLFLLNVELRRPLWGRLGGSLFADLGNVWERLPAASWSDVQLTTGVEAWFSTPVGPIRLARGLPVDRQTQLKQGTWHLAILFAF